MQQFPLYAELMLLALHDEKGTANAQKADVAAAAGGLLELLLQGTLAVDDDGVVDVNDATPTGDAVLDMILSEVASSTKPRKLKSWMKRLAKGETRVAAIQRLVDDGVVADESTKVLGVFDRSAYPEIDPQPEAEIVARLRRAVLDNEDPTERTASLLGLAKATKLLGAAFSRQELRSHKGRINEVMDEYELVNKAAAQALAAVESAVVGALVGAGIV